MIFSFFHILDMRKFSLLNRVSALSSACMSLSLLVCVCLRGVSVVTLVIDARVLNR